MIAPEDVEAIASAVAARVRELLDPEWEPVPLGQGGPWTTPPASGPVHGWRAAARVLGVSEDTLARRRARFEVNIKPEWPDQASVWSWYTGLGEKPARRPRQRRKVQGAIAGSDGPVNWDRDLDDLLK